MRISKKQTKHLNDLLNDLNCRIDDINERFVPMIRIFGTSERPAEIWFKYMYKGCCVAIGDYAEIIEYLEDNQ